MGKYYNEGNTGIENTGDGSYTGNFEAGEDNSLGNKPLEKSLSDIANIEAGTDIVDLAGLVNIANIEAGTDIRCTNCEAGEDFACWGCGECEDAIKNDNKNKRNNIEAGEDADCPECNVYAGCPDCDEDEEEFVSACNEGGCSGCHGCSDCEAGCDCGTVEEVNNKGVTDNAPYHNISDYKMVQSEFAEDSEGVDTQKS